MEDTNMDEVKTDTESDGMKKQEISDRFFVGADEKTKYYIMPPTAGAIRGADWQYNKMYTKCLMEDIPTSAEMLDILTRRGIIGTEFEQRATELAQILNTKIEILDAASDNNAKREAAVEVAAAREELFQWNQRLNGPMNNTAEQISDDSRLEHLTSSMVVESDKSQVWEDYDKYLKDTDQTLTLKARFEVMLYIQGLDSDFLEHTPEARAMREVEVEVISKAKEALEAAKAVTLEELEKTKVIEKTDKVMTKSKTAVAKRKTKSKNSSKKLEK